jgi:hypothetical protein
MDKTHKFLFAAAALMAVAACGGAKPDDGNKDAAADTQQSAASGWDATDACSLLDKAAVGAALGDTVTQTALGLVNQASGANAATSECTYTLAGGGNAVLMVRWSPIADNTPEAISMARNAIQETTKAFGKSVEDVQGAGIAAIFVPGINQMNVYLDDKRFVMLTISSAPNNSAKATAIALVKKIKS